MPITLQEFTAAAFRPFEGQGVAFLRPPSTNGERARVELHLIQVRERDSAPRPGHRVPFSLLFSLRGEQPLDDRLLHQIAEPHFEPCELLVSRVFVPELDQHDGTMFYEAVFG